MTPVIQSASADLDRNAQVVARLRMWTTGVAAVGALAYVLILGRYFGSWLEEEFEFPPLVIILLGIAPYGVAALAARFLPRTTWQAGTLLLGVVLVAGYGVFVHVYALERADLLIGFVVVSISFLQLYGIAAVAGLIVVMRAVAWFRQRMAAG